MSTLTKFLKISQAIDFWKKVFFSLESNSLVSKKFMDCFPFAGVRIDAALRDFLAKVELCGESAQREKLLALFSARYHECNPSLFKDLGWFKFLLTFLRSSRIKSQQFSIEKMIEIRNFQTKSTLSPALFYFWIPICTVRILENEWRPGKFIKCQK